MGWDQKSIGEMAFLGLYGLLHVSFLHGKNGGITDDGMKKKVVKMLTEVLHL